METNGVQDLTETVIRNEHLRQAAIITISGNHAAVIWADLQGKHLVGITLPRGITLPDDVDATNLADRARVVAPSVVRPGDVVLTNRTRRFATVGPDGLNAGDWAVLRLLP